jgi:hypothetical protein
MAEKSRNLTGEFIFLAQEGCGKKMVVRTGWEEGIRSW